MRKPTKNWVTCSAACHGYLATDYSWHISKYNYTPRRNIYAPEDIKVTNTGWLGDCGKHIEFVGKGGRKYRACHLKYIKARKGYKYKEGEVIGTMGDTGKSKGVHLHLVMWVNGKRVDPDKTLNKLIEVQEMDKLKKRIKELEKQRANYKKLSDNRNKRIQELKKELAKVKDLPPKVIEKVVEIEKIVEVEKPYTKDGVVQYIGNWITSLINKLRGNNE